jgi:hypothetical protein
MGKKIFHWERRYSRVRGFVTSISYESPKIPHLPVQTIKKPSPSGKGFELLAEIYGKLVVVKSG